MPSTRKGFALLLALFTIILFGALATAMIFAAGEETRASAMQIASTRALSDAEVALSHAIVDMDWVVVTGLRPGQHFALHVTNPSPTMVMVARLDTTCFFVQAVSPDPTGEGVNGRFVRRVGLTIEVGADSAGILRPLRVPNRGWAELF